MSLWHCDTSTVVYQEVHEFDQLVWTYQDTVHFSFKIEDTTTPYHLYLDIRHRPDYPFQNIYVKMHSYAPGKDPIIEQHSLELQEKNGSWIGDCKGQLCQLRFILRENLAFPDTGLYAITVEQFTREAQLRGMKSVSLVLEKALH